MRAAAVLVALVGLNACSNAIVNASFNSNTGLPPAAGTAVSGSQATLRVHTTNGAAAFASMFLIAAAIGGEDFHKPRPFPTFASFYDAYGSPATPQLDPERRISEQDCSRPVDYSLGNIRCK
jgi:hypothetical protein